MQFIKDKAHKLQHILSPQFWNTGSIVVLVVFCVVSLLFNHWLFSSVIPQNCLKTTIYELFQLGFYGKATCTSKLPVTTLQFSKQIREWIASFFSAWNHVNIWNSKKYHPCLPLKMMSFISMGYDRTARGTTFFCLQKQITASLCLQKQTTLGLLSLLLLQV